MAYIDSSKSIEWETPQRLFDELNYEFHFNLDVCASTSNTKCRRFITPEQDAFRKKWKGRCWMNPPYGRGIEQWIRRAVKQIQKGNANVVVCLVPSRTDTVWWHDIVLRYASEIRFVKNRLYFGDGTERAPFPSVIVVFEVTAKRDDFSVSSINNFKE